MHNDIERMQIADDTICTMYSFGMPFAMYNVIDTYNI